MTHHTTLPFMHRCIKAAKLWSSKPKWENKVRQVIRSSTLQYVEDLQSLSGYLPLHRSKVKLTGQRVLQWWIALSFFDTPLGTPRPRVDTTIPRQMLTPVTYGNGNQTFPTSIATLTLQCQGFRTKVTCPVFDLGNELDVVLGHE